MLKKLLLNIKRPIFSLFKYFAKSCGYIGSKYENIIESLIYELRLILLINVLSIGIYLFLNMINDSSDLELVKMLTKISGILMLFMFFLIIRLSIKANFKYKYHEKLDEETTLNNLRLKNYLACLPNTKKSNRLNTINKLKKFKKKLVK